MDAVSDLRCLDAETAQGIRDQLPGDAVLDDVASAVAGLSDPTRLALAHTLRAAGEVCVCDLSWILGRPEKIVSHHLGKMRGAGVVATRRDGRLVMYRLTETGTRLLAASDPAGA